MLFRKLLINLRLVKKSRERCDFVVFFNKSLSFLNHLLSELVKLVIFGATILEENIELLRLKDIVFFEPLVILFQSWNFCAESLV